MGLERRIKHEEVNSSIENIKLCEFLEWLREICSSRRSVQVQICKTAWSNERSKRLVIAPSRGGDCYISLVNSKKVT